MIPYMVGKFDPNSTRLTTGLVKYVPGRGCFRGVSSQNGDKIVTSPPPPIVERLGTSLDMAPLGKVTEWLQERLGVEGISLNRRKSEALLADGVGPEHLTEEQRVAIDSTGLTVVRHGMRVMGVPVGT